MNTQDNPQLTKLNKDADPLIISKIIEYDILSVNSRFNELEQKAEQNKKYWKGEQIDKDKLKVGDAEVFINRVLVATETMASIITSTTPLPWVIVTPKNKRGRILENKLERELRDIWEYGVNMQQKMERVLRRFFISKVGFVKVFWNDVTDAFDAKLVDLKDVRFDLDVPTLDESRFFVEYVTDTVENLISRFPDKKEYLNRVAENTTGGIRGKIRYIEYWGKSIDDKGKVQLIVCYKHNSEILAVENNPYWNRGDNHFKMQKYPYIPMNSLSLGYSVVDDTSTFENAIPVQDLINTRKRQINKNAWLANGILVTHANAMSKPTFDKINGDTSKIYLDGDIENVDAALRKVTGRALEGGVYEDMYDSKREIDNIFGTHETTRGEGGNDQTARGMMMLRDADYGRQDLTGRSYEQVAEDFYNWAIQMMYVKLKKKKAILSPKEENNSMDAYKQESGIMPESKEDYISKDDFKGLTVKVIVKKGSTRPKDPEAQREMAVMLKQTGTLNPLTFFELVGVENPRKEARREFLWTTNPVMLFPETQGEMLIEPAALGHIKDINNNIAGAEDQLFESMDLETYGKHLNTHNIYIQNGEIDEDLEVFADLDSSKQSIHRRHIEVEKERLKALLEQEQARMEQQGVSPQPVPEEGLTQAQ